MVTKNIKETLVAYQQNLLSDQGDISVISRFDFVALCLIMNVYSSATLYLIGYIFNPIYKGLLLLQLFFFVDSECNLVPINLILKKNAEKSYQQFRFR